MTTEARTAIAMVGAYAPSAIYYEEADIVEYIRADVAAVHERVDSFLTLVLDMKTREPIGFSLKGFRNFYLKRIRPTHPEVDFLPLTTVLEDAVSQFGEEVVRESRRAYLTARSIAETDGVELHELPVAA